MSVVQVGISDVPNAVCIASLPHMQLPLFAINAPVWTQSDCETERSMRESRRNENRNDIVTGMFFARIKREKFQNASVK